jgi:hypothetical protein
MGTESQIVLAAASSGALLISIVSFIFAVLSWRESHRPIVVARISTERGRNVASPIELVVENTGNRPAINVVLEADAEDLDRVLNPEASQAERAGVKRCFEADTYIPVLGNGQHVTNAFGSLQETGSTWRYKETLVVGIRYESLKGRKFFNRVPIWLVDNRGFALSFYESSS